MTDSKSWVRVADVQDIDATIPFLVELNDRAIALYRVDDVVYATDDTCSHAEASLCEGEYHGYVVTCPRHGGQFDIRTGRAVKMPAIVPIDVFPVRVEGTDVFLSPDDL
ncbi:non-heme iron oxygenase ferredoxin subunit [Sulfobacillus harzensis]|uniref:Non-heme iron oxygenase ferredoxin subunit n=1 Tax=Sulfobacillus harzensis TaxID=2729629 RepID=A0A7Y0L5L6_9FIRM|nr:non-heme iron oxygenase ferredoxin subunit [Sulfobacillus harzensis]NMP23676.1 non-heme iron oxygenase ferredoxin subunit [Sulfobacillus harzensis]